MSATVRVAAGSTPARPRQPGPPLVVVQTTRAKHGRSVFVAVVAALLVLGLAALLALNTMLAQQAFVLSSLQQRSVALTVTEQSLAAQVAALETPSQLALRARALGMRPSGPPLFLSLPDGTIVGSDAVSDAKTKAQQP